MSTDDDFRDLVASIDALSEEAERWAVEMELREELADAWSAYHEHTEIRPPGFAVLIELHHRTFRWRLAYRLARLASRIHADAAARGTM